MWEEDRCLSNATLAHVLFPPAFGEEPITRRYGQTRDCPVAPSS